MIYRQQDKSGLLWIHFAFAYLFTGFVLWLLLEEYKASKRFM